MSKIINTFFFLIVASSFIITSCNNGGIPIEKQKKYINYLSEIGAIKNTKCNYLIVPQHVCHSCIEATYEFLGKNKVTVSVILVGQTTRDSAQMADTFTRFTVYLDREELYDNRKNIDISTQNMIFFTVNSLSISNYHEITANKLEKTLKALLRNTNTN